VLREGAAAYRFATKNELHLTLRHPRWQERLRECDRRPQSPHRLRWPPSSRRPWVSRHHALAFAVLAAKNPSHLVSPQKQKRSPFVGLQEPPAPGQGPMSLPVDALPRNSVPGLASSGRSPCHFGWLKITRGAMVMFRASPAS